MQKQDLLEVLDSLPGSRKLWMRLAQAVVAYRMARKESDVTGKETNDVIVVRARLLKTRKVTEKDVQWVIEFIVQKDNEGSLDVLFDRLEGQ